MNKYNSIKNFLLICLVVGILEISSTALASIACGTANGTTRCQAPSLSSELCYSSLNNWTNTVPSIPATSWEWTCIESLGNNNFGGTPETISYSATRDISGSCLVGSPSQPQASGCGSADGRTYSTVASATSKLCRPSSTANRLGESNVTSGKIYRFCRDNITSIGGAGCSANISPNITNATPVITTPTASVAGCPTCRPVQCKDSLGIIVDDSFCNPTTKLHTMDTCTTTYSG